MLKCSLMPFQRHSFLFELKTMRNTFLPKNLLVPNDIVSDGPVRVEFDVFLDCYSFSSHSCNLMLLGKQQQLIDFVK